MAGRTDYIQIKFIIKPQELPMFWPVTKGSFRFGHQSLQTMTMTHIKLQANEQPQNTVH